MRMKRKRILALPVLLCILAGCAPRERTMLLPQAETDMEEESAASTEEYMVKKIYTYEYDCWVGLEQSAFLKECQKNEVRIIALEMQDGRQEFLGRNVDYRYGFRDEEGVFFWPWENWKETEEGEMEGDLYVDQVIPSPNGRQALVYLKSVFWDTCFVWLCEADSREPLLLYGGEIEESGVELTGAFSPDGRWVAFDVLGRITGDAGFIAVYDCQEEVQPEVQEKMKQEIRNGAEDEGELTGLYPPARTLPALGREMSYPLTGEVFDISGNVGVFTLGSVMENQLWVKYVYLEEVPGEAEPMRSEVQFFLDWEMGDRYPYPRYSMDMEKQVLYYLKNFRKLVEVDLTTGEERGAMWEFPDNVVDFRFLDSGDLLVLSTQDAIEIDEKSESHINAQSWMEGLNLQEIQTRGGIQSVDLYLYPQGDTAGKLLYKNLQDLLYMEYDEATRRILLETCENGNMERRKCIVLEL